jgi:tripartite-type tricarboxylate transporter receptor subunit TctC
MLAVTSARRWSLMPDLPTIAESGFPGFEATAWNGVVTRAGTAKSIVERLNQAFDSALAHAEVKARLNAAGLEPVGGRPEAFATLIRTEADKWGPIIRRTGAKVE